jgi:hypothetical protein
MRPRLAAFALLLLAAAPAAAQRVDGVSPAAANTPQRRAILDALRPTIEQRLRGRVEFVVLSIRVHGGWALAIATPQRPGGGAIDGRRIFGEDFENMDGLTVNAILRFRNGRWELFDHAIGPTDVWYCGMDGPPPALTGC